MPTSMGAGGHVRPADVLAALQQVADAVPGEALLLSGGVDSSLLARLASGLTAITVVLDGSDARSKAAPGEGCDRCAGFPVYPPGCGFDWRFSALLAEALGLRHRVLVLSVGEALDQLTEVVRITRSYDLGLLNDIPILAAFIEARRLGMATIWTGEMADELFAGYAVHRDEVDWPSHIDARVPSLAPPSVEFGTALGIAVSYPYLDPLILSMARGLQRGDLIEFRAGDEAGAFIDQFDHSIMASAQKPWGKVLIRRAAEAVLPREVAWRPKTDLQFGSAMCRLESELARRLTPQARKLADETGRAFRNDAHRALHALYLSLGFEPEVPGPGMDRCVSCGAGVRAASAHCRTCGAFPAGSRIIPSPAPGDS